MLGLVHEFCDIAEPLTQAVGDLTPAGMGLVAVGLSEDGLYHGADHRLVGLAHAGQQIALEMHAAALPPGAQDLACGGLQALMGVADHQLHAPQAASGQRTQEIGPERFGFRGHDGNRPSSAIRQSRSVFLTVTCPVLPGGSQPPWSCGRAGAPTPGSGPQAGAPSCCWLHRHRRSPRHSLPPASACANDTEDSHVQFRRVELIGRVISALLQRPRAIAERPRGRAETCETLPAGSTATVLHAHGGGRTRDAVP